MVSCTGAVGQVLGADAVTQAQERRDGRPLLLLDLALPRDVDPAAAAIPGVTLVDLETLATVLADSERTADVEADPGHRRRRGRGVPGVAARGQRRADGRRPARDGRGRRARRAHPAGRPAA